MNLGLTDSIFVPEKVKVKALIDPLFKEMKTSIYNETDIPFQCVHPCHSFCSKKS